MKFSVCIDMMFSYLDFYDRFEAVKKSGLDTVEFWKWSVKDIERTKNLLDKHALSLSLMNIDVEDEALSYDLSRGILTKKRSAELIRAIEESAPVCDKLSCRKLIVLIGENDEKMSREEQTENVFSSLAAAAPVAEKNGMTLVVEPLNAYDRKNYFMPESDPLAEIIRQVSSKNVKMLFDIYHQQRTEGNVIERIDKCLDIIGHFHVADSPKRTEPGTGELNWKNILNHIEESGYSEYVGLEYRATKPDELTLAFTDEVQNGKN